jgi:hypothetical protein
VTTNAGFGEIADQVAEDDTFVREAVAAFHSADDLQNAIDELLRSGFHRSALSLLATEAEVVAKLGHVYRKTTDLADDPTVPRTAYVSPEAVGDGQGAIIATLMYVAAGVLMGPVAAARGSFAQLAAAAALGGGAAGLLGTWLAKLIGEPPRDAHPRTSRSGRAVAVGANVESRSGIPRCRDPPTEFG